ncbi:MAG: Na+/H+ antiporter NhaA [Deltaproteobacteria bacterium]|nr:Na+/H+ antiporter NhaA [Deltaproteobacteria bacterium]MCB9789136.1 Na+/H+ antiporter NhaA [Deltaproteobacteria bacterium]
MTPTASPGGSPATLGPRPLALEPAAWGGILLLAASVVAVLWASSPLGHHLEGLRELPLALGYGAVTLEKPLLLWVNDGLMAIFFLLVGLEVKRELLDGSLASLKACALPVFAAAGGIAVPALVYTAFNPTGPTASGWAIPAATDIAFALGILGILGSRVPTALKVFLTTVAVVDDIGAVLIIAIFHTDALNFFPLLWAMGIFAGLLALNRMGIRNLIPYLAGGAILWFAILKTGIHPTTTGVILALAIPAVPALDGHTRAERRPPAYRLEHRLHPWVLFLIMPIFALLNAGVTFEGGADHIASPVALGVLLGLLVGKPLGILGMSLLAHRLGLAELPAGVTWRQVHGAAWLGGIGFTMSLFIAGLAFDGDGSALVQAKFGLLLGSALAAALGVAFIVAATRRPAPRSGARSQE